MQGYASGPDYSGKKATLVLFINGRPVECSPLKRAIEATYAAILPKGYKPFVFLVSSKPCRTSSGLDSAMQLAGSGAAGC